MVGNGITVMWSRYLPLFKENTSPSKLLYFHDPDEHKLQLQDHRANAAQNGQSSSTSF